MSNILIFFSDYHYDGGSKVVQATLQEWNDLIKPARDHCWSIDCSTVDQSLFDQIYDRPSIDLKLSEVEAIEYVVPLV